MKDIFGNLVDPEVDYARGQILKSSYEEKLKYIQAIKVIQNRLKTEGEESFYIFTGNIRGNQILTSDIGIMSEEWVGPAFFLDDLRKIAVKHVSGMLNTDDVAVFNRTSAANICSIMALGGPDKMVVSFAPQKKHHPSVVRGAKASNSKLIAIDSEEEFESLESATNNGGICLITSVTSELLYLDDEQLKKAIAIAKSKNLTVIVDDAYGARLRTYILGFTPALEAGADVVITNNDKAALNGPRAGIMVGRSDIVNRISAKGTEFGMEARAPICLGVYRSLTKFDPQELHDEVAIGKSLYENLKEELGGEFVNYTLLGPEIKAEALLTNLLKRTGLAISECSLVPCEVSGALGMELLKHGVVTTNALGMPGARISVRLKANRDNVSRMGGEKKVVDVFMQCIAMVSKYLNDPLVARNVILGE